MNDVPLLVHVGCLSTPSPYLTACGASSVLFGSVNVNVGAELYPVPESHILTAAILPSATLTRPLAMSAYALVYYRFKLAVPIFWLIFITLLVPLEVRIFPTYKIVSDLGLTNSYTGLILPLVASATATFFFRQFYRTIPDELLESAKLDGANSWRFFIDFLVPLSKTMIAAMFIFMFVYGYSQYLWPLIMTTSEKYWTVIMGMKIIFTESYEGVALPRTAERFAYIILSMIPPVLVVVILQVLKQEVDKQPKTQQIV